MLLIVTLQVVVGNVGDSRAVLCRGGSAVPLSHDHTPAREDEGEHCRTSSKQCLTRPPCAVARIRAAGADVQAGDVVVGGEEFSLTRAIGDSMVKVPEGRDYHDMQAPQVCRTRWPLELFPDDVCLSRW